MSNDQLRMNKNKQFLQFKFFFHIGFTEQDTAVTVDLVVSSFAVAMRVSVPIPGHSLFLKETENQQIYKRTRLAEVVKGS